MKAISHLRRMFLRRFCRKRYFKYMLGVLVFLIFWTLAGNLYDFHDEDFPEDVVYDIFIDEAREDHKHIPLDQEMLEEAHRLRQKKRYDNIKIQDPKEPIVMWWTEFTKEPGVIRSCGDQSCFFTNDRRYSKHKNMKAFMFYGTDFAAEDLPLPKEDHHEWALFHEESPKNNYLLCHEEVLTLFNHTSTFRRESDFPITTQHLLSLRWLEQSKYSKTTSQKNKYQDQEGLAPVMYVQSDCNPPSDRDEFVKQLMNFIKVDSYGACLNNKQLPRNIRSPLEGMTHNDFYELMSKYKFVLAMENAVCPDYITEKLWRPLMLGTVPVVFGSPRVKDFLPDSESAIVITDFDSVQQLAEHMRHLNSKDHSYDKLLNWKRTGVTNKLLRNTMLSRIWTPDDESNLGATHINFVEAFECHVCKKIHANMRRVSAGQELVRHSANISHYGCPKPMKFDSNGKYAKDPGWGDFWSAQWIKTKSESKVLANCVKRQETDCADY